MSRLFKSLAISAVAFSGIMMAGCTDTTVDKIVSLNNEYADNFSLTTTQEEFIEQQTAYTRSLSELTRQLTDSKANLSASELNAIERSTSRADSSMQAAATRLGL